MTQEYSTYPYWKNNPSLKQWEALDCTASRLLYGGAYGGGKSDYLLMRASLYAPISADSHSIIMRRNYTELEAAGGLITRAKDWWYGLDGVHWNAQAHKFTFPTGSTVSFGYLDTKDAHLKYASAEFTFIGIDEASDIHPESLEYMPRRLRRNNTVDIPLQYSLCANPGGRAHEFLRKHYVKSKDPNFVYIESRLEHNPGMSGESGEEYRQVLNNMSDFDKARYMHADWDIQPEGGMFEREKIKSINRNDIPQDLVLIRSWDKAATAKVNADYTVGALVGMKDGRYYVLDVKRVQYDSAEVESLIKATAREDGIQVAIAIEEEGGSSGKDVSSHYARNVLPGYNAHFIRPTGSKVDRAQIVASAIRNNNFFIASDNSWDFDLKDEFGAFPFGVNDDIVDAVSQAFKYYNENTFHWYSEGW